MQPNQEDINQRAVSIRQGISTKISDIRNAQNITIADVSRNTLLAMNTVRVIERGTRAYTLTNLLKYLQVLNCDLVLENLKEEKSLLLTTPDDFGNFVQELRQKKILSLAKVGDPAQISPIQISFIELNETVCLIDTLIKIAITQGYQVKIKINK